MNPLRSPLGAVEPTDDPPAPPQVEVYSDNHGTVTYGPEDAATIGSVLAGTKWVQANEDDLVTLVDNA